MKALVGTLLALVMVPSAVLESTERDYVKEREDYEYQSLLKCIADLAKETNSELKELQEQHCVMLVETSAMGRRMHSGLDKYNQEQEKDWIWPRNNVMKERLLRLLVDQNYIAIKDEWHRERIFTAVLESYLPTKALEADLSTRICLILVVMKWVKGTMESDLSLPKVAEKCQSAKEERDELQKQNAIKQDQENAQKALNKLKRQPATK